MIGRDLKPDEEVDHIDLDKKNFHPSNLVVRGHTDHCWKTAKQAGFMKQKLSAKEQAEYRDWVEFMHGVDKQWSAEVAACRAGGQAWEGAEDGRLQQAYEQHCQQHCQQRHKRDRKPKAVPAMPVLPTLPPRDRSWSRQKALGRSQVPF